jgi:hypothetical protein
LANRNIIAYFNVPENIQIPLLPLSAACYNLRFLYSTNYEKYYRIIWSFFSPNVFAKALNILGKATATPEDKELAGISVGRAQPLRQTVSLLLYVQTFAH